MNRLKVDKSEIIMVAGVPHAVQQFPEDIREEFLFLDELRKRMAERKMEYEISSLAVLAKIGQLNTTVSEYLAKKAASDAEESAK